jgi:SPP1 gp7 family putative phage head morphogenesis protein
VTPGWYYREERLAELLNQVHKQVQDFANQTGNSLTANQQEAMQIAQQYAQAMTHASLGPTPAGTPFGTLWTNLNQQALINIAANTKEGPLAKILGEIAPQAASAARDTIVNGVAQGYNPRKVAALLHDQLGAPLARAQTIARTEILRAQREVTQQLFQENDAVVGGWIWQAALDANTCEFCWALNGEHFDTEEGPDTHPNCRCTMIPDVKSYADAGYGDEAAAAYDDVPGDLGEIAPDIIRQGGNVDLVEGTTQVYYVTDAATRDTIERTGTIPARAPLQLRYPSLGEDQVAVSMKIPVYKLIEPLGDPHKFYLEGDQNIARYLTSGPAKFAQLSDARQLQILGPAKYRAYKAGAVELRDFIGYKDSTVWGRTGYAKSLKEVLGPTEAAKFYGPTASERALIEGARKEKIAARKLAVAQRKAAKEAAQAQAVPVPPVKPLEVLSQVEANLSSGNLSIIDDMSHGHHNAAYKVHIEGDGDAMLKPRPAPEHAEGTHHPSIPPGFDPERERAGWVMAQKFGLDSPTVVQRDVELHAPPTVVSGVTEPIGDSSVQEWRNFRPWTGGGTRQEKRNIGLFDVVVGNLDRHGGQLGMTPEGTLLAYDHGLAFPSWVVDTSGVASEYHGGFYEWTRNDVMAREFYGSTLTESEKTLLRSLDTPQVRSDLQATGLDELAIERMYHRIESLLGTGRFMSIEEADQYGMSQDDIYSSIVDAVDNWDNSGAAGSGEY